VLRSSLGGQTRHPCAQGFNNAFRRAVYLRQYREYRRRQGRLIQQTRASLDARVTSLAAQRAAQDSLLYVAEDQDATLREELAIQTDIVRQLSGSEKTLLAKISKQEKRSAQLQREIRSAINKAIAREEKQARKRQRKTGSRAPAVAPKIGASIGQRRGRLGWPVRGTIVRPFGKQQHPEVASVMITNSGIDIDAGASAAVEAIFAGEVISVREIAGLRTVVMARHGNYYTVYSNLEHPRVKVGQQIQAGDQLGLTASEGEALHFELWKGRKPLDPESWLAK
ncbi:MAG: peptidoglycan DD-metalloendopeptidase family protein, partial [Bacteroidota bacterium]